MLAIETINLTKDYSVGFWRKRPKRVLDGLSIEVKAGEIFGLLGPNGAGKSTTLKIFLRLIFPTLGTARILGKELDDISAHEQIGFLPENPYFYDNLTAEEFLNYAGELFGLPVAERQRRTARLLQQVGLEGARNVQVRKFSKGMVQRLGIGQALINDPELVFLDEPMSGLDPLGRREVRDLILSLKEKGKTVFFSTHILSDAEMLCDRVAILNRGRMQGCGELKEMLALGIASTEIVVVSPQQNLLDELKACGGACVRTGERVRVAIPKESEVSTALNKILQAGVEVVSVNPVKMSLEDYFMEQVGKDSVKRHEEELIAQTKGGR
ncbi:MAG TPA: ABC transporter ATP-binding protein [Terriglobia bacterium]|nr:ABC transporter ATP-binding protein [Terriglobia bacterium]